MRNKVILKCIGFFRELDHGNINGPSLKILQSEQPADREPQIIGYLACGIPYITSPGLVYDILEQSESPIGTGSILTDGVWAWPDDLAYYVEKYQIILPEDFMAHAMSNRWCVPEISRERLLCLHLPRDGWNS